MIHRFLILFSMVARVSGPLLAQSPGAAQGDHSHSQPLLCAVDEEAMLALSPSAFDQDPKNGWRPLADTEGCQKAAADLIQNYINRNWASLNPRTLHVMYWHLGQMEAMAGDYREAIPFLMAGAGPSDRSRIIGFQEYALGTIAFLQGDLEALKAARARLSATPMPEGFTPDSQHRWPLNLDVLDGLIRCFGSSYAQAYGSTCRTPDPN